MDTSVKWLLFVAMLFSSMGGLAIALILKHLDNIAKEYTGSIANIVTAIASRYEKL